MRVPSTTLRRGILNLSGSTAASKATAERLLKTDEESHHCFFRPGLHNHLSHHILAAYDLGAPASLLKTIYDNEAKMQRSVKTEAVPAPGVVNDDNWTNWLGNEKAYSAYLAFFSDKVADKGINKTLEEYIFSPTANRKPSHMLYRLVSGVVHPFIQVGYGLEFDSELGVAAGVAQAAVHDSDYFLYLPPEKFVDSPSSSLEASSVGKRRHPKTGPSILAILKQIYDNPTLVPVLPYDPNALLSKRQNDFVELEGGSRLTEIQQIWAHFDPGKTHEELDARVEELVFASTLLMFGTGKPNRKPRLDFFLMHLVTSSLFIPSFFKHMSNLEDKKALLRLLLQSWGMVIMTRGRPRINPALLMSYTDKPTPPGLCAQTEQPSSLGSGEANPWLAIISDVIHAPDSHTIKSLRTLLYGATKYGTLAKGEVIGAWGPDGQETHPGIGEVDGTVFIRAAGVLMDSLGWVTHGQKANEWDRSALGWDDAWNGED